ncbi:hypothetical protein HRR78_008026 [Exophiala dermatitidis]|nr:hypothetical protein HRR75_007905 [Exophiala dermatitidis]KAJ4538689.1 hypothetical protein HRR78_008026 [Exophiala dermatitidis]
MDILSLPQEILSHILSYLHPESIVKFGLSCKDAHEFISPRNQILWRAAFIQIFDDPYDAWSAMPRRKRVRKGDRIEWDWLQELQKRLRALWIIRSRWRIAAEQARLSDHLDAILSIIDTAKFAPTACEIANGIVPAQDDRHLSLNLQILTDVDRYQDGLERLIHDSENPTMVDFTVPDDITARNPRILPLWRSMGRNWNGGIQASRPESACRLHVLYGITERERIKETNCGNARRRVYDTSRYRPDNDYGPLKRDGSGQVDWYVLEGVFTLIARNFEIAARGTLSMAQGLSFSIPHRSLPVRNAPADWARVTGTWLGISSYYNHGEVVRFNMFLNGQLDTGPNLVEEPERSEGLVKLELKLDDRMSADPQLRTSLPICTDLPPLFFSDPINAQGVMFEAGSVLPREGERSDGATLSTVMEKISGSLKASNQVVSGQEESMECGHSVMIPPMRVAQSVHSVTFHLICARRQAWFWRVENLRSVKSHQAENASGNHGRVNDHSENTSQKA